MTAATAAAGRAPLQPRLPAHPRQPHRRPGRGRFPGRPGPARRTTGWSFDDAGIGDLDDRTVKSSARPLPSASPFWTGTPSTTPASTSSSSPPPPHPNFTLGNPWPATCSSPPSSTNRATTMAMASPNKARGHRLRRPAQRPGGCNGTITIFDQTTGYGRRTHPPRLADGQHLRHLVRASSQLPTWWASHWPAAGFTGAPAMPMAYMHLNLQHIGHGLAGYVVPTWSTRCPL